MNKRELVVKIAQTTELAQRDAEWTLNAAIEIITAALASGDEVQIQGFGVFKRRMRAARMGRNPKTKEPFPIPASCAPVFRPGKVLKEAVAAGKERGE